MGVLTTTGGEPASGRSNRGILQSRSDDSFTAKLPPTSCPRSLEMGIDKVQVPGKGSSVGGLKPGIASNPSYKQCCQASDHDMTRATRS